jgi:hypothetical protein
MSRTRLTPRPTAAARVGPRVRDLERWRQPGPRREEDVIVNRHRIDVVTRHVELCLESSGDTVVLLTAQNTELADVVRFCLDSLDCEIIEIQVSSGIDPVCHPSVSSALDGADLVIDLARATRPQPDHGANRLSETASSGPAPRTLAIGIDDIAVLDHLVAHPGLARRADRLGALVAAGHDLVIDTPDGAQLVVGVAGADAIADVGRPTDSAPHADWPASAVWIEPDSELVRGLILAMPGDLITGSGHILRSPVQLEVEGGHLVEIHGDSGDADMVRAQLEHQGDDDAYLLCRVGLGLGLTRPLPPSQLFHTGRLAPGRGPDAAGACTISFGDGAVDLTLTSVSVALDDAPLVVDGGLVGPLLPDVYERAAGDL